MIKVVEMIKKYIIVSIYYIVDLGRIEIVHGGI